ncbi:MAG: glutamyl-tRNA reductase [Chitinophagaceae bacterium]|nr:glutamyl-tRNA reductase [Chitinophagaceae bacterium]
MHGFSSKNISNFFVAGLNYRKSDASVRGQFAISNDQYSSILQLASTKHLSELFILSTCNRTEIYGFASNADELINLLCSETVGDAETFRKLAYIKKSDAAVQHLFAVASGLDSQLLGDYEIVGQLKTAVRFAKERGFAGAFTDRLVNIVLQSSKTIKNTTQLSGGTVSVSFAAVQYIKENIRDIKQKKILLLGIGKIGRNTCKNLADYLGTTNITLINRSPEKAVELARELGLKHASADKLNEEVIAADIIIVATNASTPIINASHLLNTASKLIIDLSIPFNVDDEVRSIDGVTLINVDELSKLKDQTLRKREADVPKAKMIIAEYLIEFEEWQEMRKHVPVLKAVKTKLSQIHTDPLFLPLYNYDHTDAKIQRVINGMATKMKTVNQKGCYYIEAINEFIAAGTN